MVFDTQRGSRGARQPRGRWLVWLNRLVAGRVRRGGGKLAGGMDVLVLTTVGRRTGVERQTPVGWFPGDDSTWLIVASAAGATGNPAWYFNLAAHPDKVLVEVGGRRVTVTADQLHGAEREQAWERIVAAAPRFGQYQQKTDRELPVIRLTPRPE